MRKFLILATAFSTLVIAAAPGQKARDPVSFDQGTKVFRLDGGGVTYAFGVNERGELEPVYWGARLQHGDKLSPAHSRPEVASFDFSTTTTPQEYAGWGAGLYTEPALKVSYPDGNRDLVLHYVSHAISGQSLKVRLKDIERDVFVTLTYTIDEDTGVLARSARIENGTKSSLEVEQAASGTWTLPAAGNYSLYYLTGRWAGEWQIQHEALRAGARVLESRRGSTGHQNNPWFAIERTANGRTEYPTLPAAGNSRPDVSDQDSGEVWLGALGWSGSWRITVELDQMQQPRITGGYNPFDFGYKLGPGESLDTPVFYGGYTRDGIGGASRLLHRFELSRIVPEAPHPKPRPVIYNSWEATEFNFNDATQEALAEKAASIGVERFVVDDGWFGQRNTDKAGLGDWYVNPQKFPHGLKPLIDKVHSLGMDFGLWVEPEMVNPDSDLYRKHPDWVLNFPGRPRTEGRNQLVLNLARADVRAYVFNFLDKLLTDNQIAFLKWDYNRNWSEPGWPQVAPDEQKRVYVQYTENLYGILRELRAKHRGVEIESCSGGGGRVDLGILRYTDEVWPSDNTDPFDRLTIQDGFTYAYAPQLMAAWVTDSPNWVNQRVTSLSYRFLSSMEGALGVGANLNHWQPEDFATAKRLIGEYKEIRTTVQQGALYRLVSPRESQTAATEYVARDGGQAVVFGFLHSSSFGYPFPTVYPRGLDSNAEYRAHWVYQEPQRDQAGGASGIAEGAVQSGSYWMGEGVKLRLRGDFQAAALRLDRVAK
jgi:alpha-galactosidase